MDMTSYLRGVVTKLAGEIGVRSHLHPEQLDETARFVAGEFEAFGLPVTRQGFTFRKRRYENVVAAAGVPEAHERTLVIGAHYDTVRTTPGADDNASGIAGLLGLAMLLAAAPPRVSVRLAAFALEEPPAYRSRNMGSYHYARSLFEAGQAIDGMICLEMIGYFSEREGSQRFPLPFMKRWFSGTGNFIAMVGNRRSSAFTTAVAEGFRRGTDLPVFTLNAPAAVVGIDFSDHWSFGKFGYRALMVTDTAFYRNPHYHSPSDLPETLDYGRMAQVVEGLAVAVRGWGG